MNKLYSMQSSSLLIGCLLNQPKLLLNNRFSLEGDVIEFIYERIYTKDFQDSYIDCGGYGEPNEMVKQTAEDKRILLYDFMMSLIDKD